MFQNVFIDKLCTTITTSEFKGMKSVPRKRWSLLMELGLFLLWLEGGRKAAPSAPLKTRRNR